MGYPYTQLLGDTAVTFTSTATLAVEGTVAQKIGISLGLPVIEQIADILVRFKIPRSAHLSNKARLLYKITFGAVTLDNSLTFAAQGVRRDDVLILADV